MLPFLLFLAAVAGGSTGLPSSSGSTASISISAHITCNPKVRVFRGSTGGSGTYGWESYNSTVSWSVRTGEQICVCDASDERRSCWTASGGPRVDLDISCEGISQR